MIKLERANVVRIVESETQAERLEAMGFQRIKESVEPEESMPAEESAEPNESSDDKHDTGTTKQNRRRNTANVKIKG